jgi:hypothetical protein
MKLYDSTYMHYLIQFTDAENRIMVAQGWEEDGYTESVM